MRNIGLLLLFFTSFAFAQNKQVLYGFPNIPQAQLLNPGSEISNDWYVGMPLLSQVHFNFGMTGLSANDLFATDGRDFSAKLQETVYNMDNKDFFAFNQQLDLFSGGFAFGKGFVKDQYISFGMYQETDMIFYFPKDYAVLAYEGNYNNLDRNFNLGDLSLRAEVISAFHIGYAKQMSKKLTLGARAKIYSSVFNVNSTKNEGSFVTTLGDSNYLNHQIQMNVSVQTSGLASLTSDENSEFSNDIKALRKRLFFGGNLGLGFDLGFTYKFDDQWTLDGSLLDVGFIRHSKDVETQSVDGYYETEGVEVLFPEVGAGQSAEEYWDKLSDELKDAFEVDSTYTVYTTWRPIKLNAALSYGFNSNQANDCNCKKGDEDYTNKVGVQLFAISRPKQPQMALTAFYYKRIFKGLDVKATYTVDSFSAKNLGFGLSTQIGVVNFYAMADNILNYQNLANAKSVSLQFGLNFIIKTKEIR